jgi:lipopolysaccharide biosynthesis protein
MNYVRKDFGGLVMDYADIVINKKYFNYDFKKMYRAVMPMWDNTARRDNKGMIFHGASPALYKQWLSDLISHQKIAHELPDKFIFINAWNEWGEGAYLEPDKYYGYAYLNATREAIEEAR